MKKSIKDSIRIFINTKHPFRLVALVFFVMVIFFLLMPIGLDDFENALVNPENGDVAIVYFNNEAKGFTLELYDKDANLLFKKNIYNGESGYAELRFAGTDLHVNAVRTDYYVFNRSGEPQDYSDSDIAATKDVEAKDCWINAGWTYVYNYEDYTYIWKKAAPGVWHMDFKIIKDGKETVLYSDSKFD